MSRVGVDICPCQDFVGKNFFNYKLQYRELQNAIDRAYYLAEGEIITEDYFPENIERKNCEEDINVTAVLPFDVIEEKNIKEALRLAKGDVVKAAKMLNLSRATIYRKIKKYKVNLKELSSLVETK